MQKTVVGSIFFASYQNRICRDERGRIMRFEKRNQDGSKIEVKDLRVEMEERQRA